MPPRPDPGLAPDTDLVDYLLSLPPDTRRQAIDLMGSVERDTFDRHWRNWAHPGQEPPDDDPGGPPGGPG